LDLRQRGELRERFLNVSDEAMVESVQCAVATLNDLMYAMAERGYLVALDWDEDEGEALVEISVYKKVL
jgi:hypothetical protein